MIKKLDQTNQKEIKALFLKVFTDEPWNDQWTDNQVNLYLNDLMNNSNSLSIGYYIEDCLIGLSLGYIFHWWQGTDYYVKELCIDSKYQNQGHGKLFLSLIEGYLKENNVTAYYLNTENDVIAYQFYLKNGFKELKNNVVLAKNIR